MKMPYLAMILIMVITIAKAQGNSQSDVLFKELFDEISYEQRDELWKQLEAEARPKVKQIKETPLNAAHVKENRFKTPYDNNKLRDTWLNLSFGHRNY